MAENGKMPEYEYIASIVNKDTDKKLSGEDIELLLASYKQLSISSLYDPVGEEGEKIDFIQSENTEIKFDEGLKEKVEKIFAKNPKHEFEQKVINAIFYSGKNIEEVATDWNMPREKVRQAYDKGLRFLRLHLRDSKFSEL